jgi:1-deoxy-D-xylulose-5-phosphate synthase
VTPFDKVTGISPKKQEGAPTYTKVFGKAVVDIARSNPKVVAITAAMPDGTGLDQLQKAMPERFYDVGIAEQHAVTFAAGLATQGAIPIVAVYSTFLQRAYDQIIHDVALQHLHVVFALDRGGLVGADGPTHHGVFDLSYLRAVPGMIVMAPKDESELRDMLYTAVEYDGSGPIALRYPRGNGLGVPLREGFSRIPIGIAETLKKGSDVALLALGATVDSSIRAADILAQEGISAEVVNMRFAKPLDAEALRDVATRIGRIVTVEDNVVIGGFGSAVAEHLTGESFSGVHLLRLGIPDRFVEHGSPQELAAEIGLDPAGIAASVRRFVAVGKLNAS